MPVVYICFAAPDRGIAESIRQRLELTAEVTVVLNEVPVRMLPENWEAGGDQDGIILLLSKSAVPAQATREDWQEILLHLEQNRTPALMCVAVEQCAWPPLLDRRHYVVRWHAQETLSLLQQWAIRLHRDEIPDFIPAAQPQFTGRDAELTRLSQALSENRSTVVITGPGGAGKTSLALEFARRTMPFYRQQIWLSCRDRSESCLASELAGSKVGFDSPWPRILLVLDGLEEPGLLRSLPDGHASILVTSTQPHAGFPELALKPGSVPEPATPNDEAERNLWEAASACRPDQVRLELAAAIARVPLTTASVLAANLADRRVLAPIDEVTGACRCIRVASLSSERAVELRRRQADALIRSPGVYVPDARANITWSCQWDWQSAVKLAAPLISWLSAERRFTEALEVISELERWAERRGDPEALQMVRRERSWISGSPPPGTRVGEPYQTGFDWS